MGNYNPHAPYIVGQEWASIRNEDLIFSPSVNSEERGASFRNMVPQTFSDGRFYVHQLPDESAFYQVVQLGVYQGGIIDDAGPIEQLIIPISNVTVTGHTGGVNGVAAGQYTEALTSPGDNKYVYFTKGVGTPNFNAGKLSFYFKANDYPQLSGKRILNVSMLYRGSVQDGNGVVGGPFDFVNPIAASLTILAQLNDAGVGQGFSSLKFFSETGTLTLNTKIGSAAFSLQNAQTYALNIGDVNNCWDSTNPAGTDEKLPWAYSDLQRFEFGGANRQHLELQVNLPETAIGTTSVIAFLDYIALRVIFCDERRTLVGGQQFKYSYGMNKITMRNALSRGTNPTLEPGIWVPTISAVSMGQVGLGFGTTGQFPKLNALRQVYEIPSHRGVKLNIPFPLENRIGSELTEESSDVLPQLSFHDTTGAPIKEVHVYGRQAAAQVYGGVSASQEINAGPVTTGGILIGGGGYATTPDNAVLDITGDIELRADVTLNDWTLGGGIFPGLVSKWNQNGVNQRSYLLQVTDTGLVRIGWSNDGTAVLVAQSTAVVPIASGRLAVRANLDVNNGAAGRTIRFFTAPTMAGPWTQLGTDVVQAGVTSIFNSTADVQVGGHSGAAFADQNGYKIHSAEVRIGNALASGAAVTAPRFDRQPAGTTAFTDVLGRTWTLAGGATISQAVSMTAGLTQGYPQVRYYARRFADTQISLRLTGLSAGGLYVPIYLITGVPASTPDAAILDITGDIDVRIDLTPALWGGGIFQSVISKFQAAAQQSWLFQIIDTGALTFLWSTTGADLLQAFSTAVVPFEHGHRGAIRAVLDVNNGAAGRTIRFYTASTLTGPWTQLGADVVQGGVTSIFNSTTAVVVGGHSGTAEFRGIVHAAEVRNGIDGTVVANPNFSAQAAGVTSFADAAGRTWTVAAPGGTITAATTAASSIDLTPAAWDELPELIDDWKEVTQRFLVAPTFDVDVIPTWQWSSGENYGRRWEVMGSGAPAISGIGGSLLTQVPAAQRLSAATYGAVNNVGATVNLGWVPGITPHVTSTTDDPFSDAMIVVSMDPQLITGLTVNTLTQTVTGFTECTRGPCCVPTGIQYNRVTWTRPIGATSMLLPPDTISYATTPDTAALDITGDIDVRADITLENWGANIYQSIVSKWDEAFNVSYRFAVSNASRLQFAFSTNGDGGGIFGAETTDAVFPDATGRLAVRATVDVDNGAGGFVVTFYTAPSMAGPWSLVSSTTGAPVVTFFSGTARLEVGGNSQGGATSINGKIHSVELRSGIGGSIVANPDFTAQPLGTTSFTDSTGKVWTLVGDAEIVYTSPGNSVLELQRQDDITDWQTIMRATNVGIAGFSDYEARVGMTSRYRVRSLNALDFFGSWSVTGGGTITGAGVSLPSCGTNKRGVLIFTTNEDQDGSSNLAYAMTWEDQISEDFSFPEADTVTIQRHHDRDFQIAFHGSERGGETFSRQLLLANAAVALPRLGNMHSLRDLAWEDVSYVCVRDDIGDRWLATIIVPGGSVRRNRRLYNALITVVEVTDTPSEVDP